MRRRRGLHLREQSDKANALAEELAKGGRKVVAIQNDAGDFNAAQAAVDQAVTEFGRLDVLVNNAGITRDQLLMRMSEEDWDRRDRRQPQERLQHDQGR